MLTRDYKIATVSTLDNFSFISGGVVNFAFSFFKSLFPRNYFKYWYSDLMAAEEAMKNEDLYKKPYPQLAITSEITLEDTMMGPQPFAYRVGEFIRLDTKSYPEIFEDKDLGLTIYYVPQRVKFKFSFSVKVMTRMSLINLVQYINQTVKVEWPFYLNHKKFENVFPPAILDSIVAIKNININDPTEQKQFMDYLNERCSFPINYKLDSGRGKHFFVHLFMTNVLCKFMSPPSQDKQDKGLSKDQGNISKIDLEMELNVPMNYICYTKHDTLYGKIKEQSSMINPDGNNIVITYVNLKEIKEYHDNKKLFVNQDFVTEINVQTDVLNLKQIFEGVDLLSVFEKIKIKRDKYKEIPNIYDFDNFTYIEVRVNDEVLVNKPDDIKYVMNWDNYLLVLNNPYYNVQHTFLLYVDMKIINEVFEEIKHF